MAGAHAHSIALVGLDGHQVKITAEASAGPPALVLADLPETSRRETRDRVRAAVLNSGEPWPAGHLQVTLLPRTGHGQGCVFDLAIAVAILAAAGTVPAPPSRAVFLGELGLDDTLRPRPRVLPAVRVAATEGVGEVIVPDANAAELL